MNRKRSVVAVHVKSKRRRRGEPAIGCYCPHTLAVACLVAAISIPISVNNAPAIA